jgi:BMFP domain-containing protein YqiC
MIAMTIFIAQNLTSGWPTIPNAAAGWRARAAPGRRTSGRIQAAPVAGTACEISYSRFRRAPTERRPSPPHTAAAPDLRRQWLQSRLPWRVPAMISLSAIDDFARRLAELVPADARAARDDLVANFRDALRGGLRKLDLVTREEFDVQRGVLLRTREMVEALEARVAELEERQGGRSPK